MFNLDINTGGASVNMRQAEAENERLANAATASRERRPSLYVRMAGWFVNFLVALEEQRLARTTSTAGSVQSRKTQCICPPTA
jgi:hypothetical protein